VAFTRTSFFASLSSGEIKLKEIVDRCQKLPDPAIYLYGGPLGRNPTRCMKFTDSFKSEEHEDHHNLFHLREAYVFLLMV
jgi:hypothetical protein